MGKVMQPLTGPYVYGVNRRSGNFLLLSDLLFARGRCTRSRYKRVEICLRVVLGCVFEIMMCSKVIYTGLIKTEFFCCYICFVHFIVCCILIPR